ncbi:MULTISPECIES: phosphate-starvation-inducible PsiE family protein [unclassified Synechococcus]|uniref:phosphate-starvation-inducible PsiE family protein n=1 Tax=unclassified Synechococcus TaxID=2626047 RepID=UPI0018CF7BB3|nr:MULTISPECIES: phosphate-starvation-inducible PsiE family protein [unclassified Synechococcus]MEA5422669.1 phosphate-starvation-inducible PsiE family protein [Synechococcus sp. CCY9202]QPN59789.1 phosphate-starvation-inducible PsiE family protein [Synechococcus sp. CBW1002]
MKTRPWFRRVTDDGGFLHLIDRGEQQLAKLLALVLCVVIAAATFQLVAVVIGSLFTSNSRWMGDDLTAVLGDLLNLLIALEVLQNITSYLRRHVVQIELVLLTAITAVARKVIVLPPGAENKPQLLVGLGIAVLSLAAAFWLVRSLSLRKPPSRTGPAIRNREPDPSVPDDGLDEL